MMNFCGSGSIYICDLLLVPENHLGYGTINDTEDMPKTENRLGACFVLFFFIFYHEVELNFTCVKRLLFG